MLRFLHAADLHLGSSLSAFTPTVAARRREGQFAALEHLFAAARQGGAQFFLLAGDVFDSPNPPRDIAIRLFSLLGEQGVPVVITPGNHDPYRPGSVWQKSVLPQNVYVFDRPSLSYFDFPQLGTAVYGYAFIGENMTAPRLEAELIPDRISLLAAHGDLLSATSPYAPLSPGQLERSGFTYAALGHIHNPMAPRRFGRTVAAYSGFFTGRGFDELGQGQALLVETDGEYLNATPVLSDAAPYLWHKLDCTGAENGEEIRQRVRQWLGEQAFPAATALRVSLTGNVGVSCHADPAALLALGAGLDLFEVRDETLPLQDADYLLKDPTLRGAFYRALLPRLQSEEEATRHMAVQALRMGMDAFDGREV